MGYDTRVRIHTNFENEAIAVEGKISLNTTLI